MRVSIASIYVAVTACCVSLSAQTALEGKATTQLHKRQDAPSTADQHSSSATPKIVATTATKAEQKPRIACSLATLSGANDKIRPLDGCSAGCLGAYCVIGDSYPCASRPCAQTKDLAQCGIGSEYYAGYESITGCQAPYCGPPTCTDIPCWTE